MWGRWMMAMLCLQLVKRHIVTQITVFLCTRGGVLQYSILLLKVESLVGKKRLTVWQSKIQYQTRLSL